MFGSNCLVRTSCTSSGSACWLMNTERSVWFGYTGTRTPVILRVTFFFVPIVVVVFLTTSAIWTSPQRSACAAGPVTVLVVVTICFFTAAPAAGLAITAAVAAAVSAIRIWAPSLEGELLDVDVTAPDAGE